MRRQALRFTNAVGNQGLEGEWLQILMLTPESCKRGVFPNPASMWSKEPHFVNRSLFGRSPARGKQHVAKIGRAECQKIGVRV